MATYTYSRTFQTSEMRRLTCDGFRGDYTSMNWANSGYTGSGDNIALVLPSTVTITMQKVTATWFNNAGGCSYNFYIDLHTTTGTYTSSTVNYAWPAGGGTNTIVLTIPGVTGEWTSFDIWGQNWTMSEKKTEYPYVYWFNNSAGTVTVKYATESGSSGSGLMAGEGGTWKNGEYYVWKNSNPTTYYYPEAAMTSNTSQNCTVSCDSTVSSSYPAWRAFDKESSTASWCSADNNNSHWIQIIYPRPLYNITVQIRNRNDKAYVNGMTSGIIYGVGEDGSTLTELLQITGRDGGTRNLLTEHKLNNSTIAYSGIRIQATAIQHYSSDKYLSIQQILIKGNDIPSTGGWIKAKPLVWKTTGAKTYTYPEAAMTDFYSQNCLVLTSSDRYSYRGWQCFDKSTSSIWSSNSKDSNHWIQLTFPRPLYNIQVILQNRASGDVRGPIEAIVYGSNNIGMNLTQLKSFSNLNYANGASNTLECGNTTVPYNTVRILFNKWSNKGVEASGSGSNIVLGDISIVGTDIGTNGYWAGEIPFNIITYPKKAMASNISQDCISSASSTYSSSHYAYLAFDKSGATGWPSSSSATSPQWIQLIMPEPLYNIRITMLNDNDTVKAPANGIVYGSNDDGTTLTQIGSYSNRDSVAGNSTSIICNNSNIAYNTIRVSVTSWYNTSGTVITSGANIDLGELFIYGTTKP